VSDDDRVDVPQATIDREFEQAEQMLMDATKAHEVGISKATVVTGSTTPASTLPKPPSTPADSILSHMAGFRHFSTRS